MWIPGKSFARWFFEEFVIKCLWILQKVTPPLCLCVVSGMWQSKAFNWRRLDHCLALHDQIPKLIDRVGTWEPTGHTDDCNGIGGVLRKIVGVVIIVNAVDTININMTVHVTVDVAVP